MTSGVVQRFRCRNCGKSFSDRTFDIDYYSKKKVDYISLLQRHISSESGRAISRAMMISQATVQNRIDRMARQAIAAHTELMKYARNDDKVSIDALVSFDYSQDFPTELTMAIASESRYILGMSHAMRRRSGKKTARQAERGKKLYAETGMERGAIGRAFTDILDLLAQNRPPEPRRPLILTTDEKPEYARAIRSHRLFREQDDQHRFIHRTVSSKLPRTHANPLFASNYLEREIRKDQANHHRESTCFSRNSANALSRLTCYVFHHNYLKKYLIKTSTRDMRTHAEVAGVPREMVEKTMLATFRCRAFLSRITVHPVFERIWRKNVRTPTRHMQAYIPAFALS